MMPVHPVRDLLERTLANLDFVKIHAGADGPFEFTQLLNSCLAVICHPWEDMKDGLKDCGWDKARQLGWQRLPKARSTDTDTLSFHDELRQLRNGLAHGNLQLYPDQDGHIRGVHIWNERHGQRIWGSVLTVKELEQVLRCFANIAKTELKDLSVRSAV